MTDLSDPRVLWAKAILFVVCGTLAGVGLLLEHPTLWSALLLGLVIWSFCRAYYFAFYVVERYVDPSFRFAGVLSLLRYVVRGRRSQVRRGRSILEEFVAFFVAGFARIQQTTATGRNSCESSYGHTRR